MTCAIVFRLMMKTLSIMIIAALATPTSTVEAAPATMEIAIQQRTETTGGMTVRYTMNERAFQATAIVGSSATTLRITESGRLLLAATAYRNGGGVLENHRGVSYTTEQLRNDPSLAAEFDHLALAALDETVATRISIGDSANPGCNANPIVAVACVYASCVGWFCNGFLCYEYWKCD